jgi:hypothetical protein
MVFKATINNILVIVAVSFIGGGNLRIRKVKLSYWPFVQ